METEAREPVEEEQEEVGGETAMDSSMHIQTVLANAVASAPPPTPYHTYSTMLSPSMATPPPIYS